MGEAEDSLQDFPLHAETEEGLPLPFADAILLTPSRKAAPLASRVTAAAADGAAVLFLTALAILGARLVSGQSPRSAGLLWAAGFLVYLSMFTTVPLLILFGKTIGMALADLSLPPCADGSRISAGGAFRRWAGTLATAVSLGLILLWTARDAAAPTLADRLSGRPLALD